jgi:uncharacterized membrane protein YfcA
MKKPVAVAGISAGRHAAAGRVMPFDLGPGAALWMAAAILVAAFVRGYSGFGYSAMVIAASSLVTNPLNFVAVVVLLEFAMSAAGLARRGARCRLAAGGLAAGGAAVGLPLGLWALTAMSEDAARAVISAYVLAMCGCCWRAGGCRPRCGGPANWGRG